MGKDRDKNKAKVNIPIRAAAVLLCLTLCSTSLVSGLFARYAASALNSNSARVAKFSIEGSGRLLQSVKAELIPGGSQDVEIVIENNSEVAVEYTVTVTKETDNLPLLIGVKKSGSADPALTADTATITEQQIAGSHTDTYTLRIVWPAEEEADRDPSRMGMVDHIVVTVTAVQID